MESAYIQDEWLEQEARKYYSPELHYHNFSHIESVLAAGREIIARCRDEGVRIDDEVVYYALLLHDAGYREDHIKKGFDSKEAYSAQIARNLLSKGDHTEAFIAKVEKAIMATHRDGTFVSTEQKAVRAADLSGLAADYEVFRGNTDNLRKEQELLTGESIDWEDWKKRVDKVISFYLSQEIRITSYFTDGQGKSIFHQRTSENLRRLMAE